MGQQVALSKVLPQLWGTTSSRISKALDSIIKARPKRIKLIPSNLTKSSRTFIGIQKYPVSISIKKKKKKLSELYPIYKWPKKEMQRKNKPLLAIHEAPSWLCKGKHMASAVLLSGFRKRINVQSPRWHLWHRIPSFKECCLRGSAVNLFPQLSKLRQVLITPLFLRLNNLK